MNGTDKITPQDVINARKATGLSQTQAAEAVGVAFRTWQDWELGIAEPHPAAFRLFLHLAGIEKIEFATLKWRERTVNPLIAALQDKPRSRRPKSGKARRR